jgi:Cof subfamily protein (haloacid dehalogenase superfamily)
MIITDLDNSLLNNERNITKYTKNIFEKCMKNDIIVVFATARPLRLTRKFFGQVKPHAVICHNGAVAFADNKRIYQCGINKKTGKYFIKIVLEKHPKANVAIENNDMIYTNFDASIYWGNIEYKNIDIENLPGEELDKIIIGMESVEKIKLTEKYLPNELYLEINEGKLGLIMNKGATKWNAIKELLTYYKIKERDTIAFGDDFNDLEMIKNYGIAKWIEEKIL